MKQVLYLVIICFLFSSCEEDDCQTKGLSTAIEEWTIPDTVMNNENVQIFVKASAPNLCWSDLSVELIEEKQFEYSIKAFGTFTCCKGGCACAAAMLYKDTIISFQPTQKGIYLFSIYKIPIIYDRPNSIDIDTMIVE